MVPLMDYLAEGMEKLRAYSMDLMLVMLNAPLMDFVLVHLLAGFYLLMFHKSQDDELDISLVDTYVVSWLGNV